MITIVSSKRMKALEGRILELERKVQNVEVEVFSPIAEAEMPDKSIKKRITLKGAVSSMYMKLNPPRNSSKPVIHRI